jgi:outer membrane lipoprotein SlyB
MRAVSIKWLLSLLLPATLAVGLGACSSGTMQPGGGYTSAAGSYSGESGRVVSIREVPLRGSNSGASTGTFVGGGLGAAGGAAIGAATTHSVVGAVVGGLLGAVGGAIAGTAIDSSGSTRRGIEVTVQRDDGQKVAIAQYDDGDIQMGDRVTIVTDRNGVARAVRDTGTYRRDS